MNCTTHYAACFDYQTGKEKHVFGKVHYLWYIICNSTKSMSGIQWLFMREFVSKSNFYLIIQYFMNIEGYLTK